MRYGSDRTRMHEITGKRAVENKDFGPLVKTSMNRWVRSASVPARNVLSFSDTLTLSFLLSCIQCTRCVRFANEVAGVEDLGTTGRGNDLQIGMYVEKVMDSEMSGNIVDLCPVGALTSKPYAFQSRPWELKKTESVDVLDAVGSNIRVDSRGVQVMRIQPRINDEVGRVSPLRCAVEWKEDSRRLFSQVNEEWINDKTRYAYDGLRFQRLTTPLIRQGDRFVPAGWHDALTAIQAGLAKSGARGDEIQAVAGHLADTESLVALRDLVHRLGSENLVLDQPKGELPPVGGVDVRSNYLFNSTIAGLDEADAVLLIGTDPRHEAAIVNTRLRKSYLQSPVQFGLVGEKVDLTYQYEHLGQDGASLAAFLEGKGAGGDSAFAKAFKEAKKPLIIVGSGVGEQEGAEGVYATLAKYVEANKERFVTDEWQGLSILQRVRPLVPFLVLFSIRLTSDRPSPPPHPFPPRLPPELPLTTSASPRRPSRPRLRLSSSTFSTPTRSPLPRSPRTPSSSIRATTVTSAPSSPTFVSPAQPTLRRPPRGSTPRVALRLVGPLSPRREPPARTGRSFGRCPRSSSSRVRCRTTTFTS